MNLLINPNVRVKINSRRIITISQSCVDAALMNMSSHCEIIKMPYNVKNNNCFFLSIESVLFCLKKKY